jgi:hypothetical protein
MNGFSTRNEAIYRQIIEPLQSDPDVKIDFTASSGEDQVRALYDVDAIADIVLGDYDEGYLVKPGEYGGLTAEMVEDGESNDAGVEAFWGVVREHAL